MDNEKLLSSPAYRMFLEELTKHLEKASGIIDALEPDAALKAGERTSLSSSFHTIRGGAGFFALTEIAQKSKVLEELLQVPAPGNDVQEVRSLVLELNQIASSLPR